MRALLLSLMMSPLTLLAQEVIHGRVYGDHTPIPYCSVYFSDFPRIGITSNEAGEYRLPVPDSLSGRRVTFSSIGFKKSEVTVTELRVNPNIHLQEAVTILEEVDITASITEGELLARKVFKNFDKNSPRSIHLLKAFYRELSFTKDSVYQWLQEADLTIQDYGYKKDGEVVKIQINELRRSDDNRKKIEKIASIRNGRSEFKHQNNLYETFQTPIRNIHSKNLRLGKSFVETHEFYLEGYVPGQDSLVILGYESIYNQQNRNYSGRLTINRNDYGIVQMEDFARFYEDHIYTITKFQKVKGRYYPAFIKEVTPGRDDYDHEVQVRTIMFYKIFSDKKDIERITPEKTCESENSIDETVFPYHELFWNSFKTVKEFGLTPRAIETLEVKTPLGEQFKKNGGMED